MGIERQGEKHRADAVLGSGTVIELQKSTISVPEIRTREKFYDRMVWLFDARQAYEDDRLLLRDRVAYFSFRWKHARKSVAYANKPVRLDLGGGKVLDVRKIHRGSPCGGWGYLNFVTALDDGKPLRDQRDSDEYLRDYSDELARRLSKEADEDGFL